MWIMDWAWIEVKSLNFQFVKGTDKTQVEKGFSSVFLIYV